MPQPFFALIILGIGSWNFAWADLDCDPPIYAYHIDGIPSACHHIQTAIGEVGSE
jgi:hypothetical protein